jgi:hypothetical protein
MQQTLDNFDELGADTIGGGSDGTDSPYMGQDMYNGGREDVILGDLDALGMSAGFGGDFVGGAAPFEYEPQLKFGLDDFEDLTALGIDEPMTWGSDSPCTMGWDEMGVDVFGWSPFAAVASAVKKVGTTLKPPVIRAAVNVAKPAPPKPAATGLAATLAKAKAAQVATAAANAARAKAAADAAAKAKANAAMSAAAASQRAGAAAAANAARVAAAAKAAAAAKPASAATTALLKSSIVKPVNGGAALVFRPSGVPMAAGLAAAAGIAAAVKSPIPAQAAAAKQVVINTHQVASTPGPDQKAAQVSLAAMALAANAKKGEAAANAPKPAPVFVPFAAPQKAPPASPNLPAVAVGGRRIANVFGSRRITHDISPQGYIATYVT